jgi:hypothetical protein
MSSDVDDFGRAIAENQLERAAELYAGPFLDGFHLGGCHEFERWVDDERARLSLAARRTLEALAEKNAAAGRHADAVRWWRGLAALDPYDARVALELMKALAANGDRAGALRHAQTWQALTSDELGARPDSAIAALAAALEQAAPPVTASPTPIDISMGAPVVSAASASGYIAPDRATQSETDTRTRQKNRASTLRRIALAAVLAVAVTLMLFAARSGNAGHIRETLARMRRVEARTRSR